MSFFAEFLREESSKLKVEIEEPTVFELIKNSLYRQVYSEIDKVALQGMRVKLLLFDDFCARSRSTCAEALCSDEETVLIAFGNHRLYADFTRTKLYWRKMKKCLTKLILGPHHAKLSKVPGRSGKALSKFKSLTEIKYDFSKCKIVHNFDELFFDLMGRAQADTNKADLDTNTLMQQFETNWSTLFLHFVHSRVLDPLLTQHLINWSLGNPERQAKKGSSGRYTDTDYMCLFDDSGPSRAEFYSQLAGIKMQFILQDGEEKQGKYSIADFDVQIVPYDESQHKEFRKFVKLAQEHMTIMKCFSEQAYKLVAFVSIKVGRGD